MKNKAVFNTVWLQPHKPKNFDDSDHDLKYKRDIYNLPSEKQGIIPQCKFPWNSITVDYLGRIFICRCDGWLPFPVGHVLDFSSIDDIFNSVEAKKIQQSIITKTYEFCATDVCGLYTQEDVDDCIDLNLTVDTSCNLSCPSCRERLIFINDPTLLEEKMSWIIKISEWVNQTDRKINVRYGGGDPLASLLYKKTFELFSKNANVTFTLMTNGLLIKNNIQYIEDIFDRTRLEISIDAATKATYEKVRRGGKWEQLLENLEYLKSKGKVNTGIFVIQVDNFKEIPAFIDFCRQYFMAPVFSLIQDWGTWHNFEEHCVHTPNSPYYEEFLKITKDYNIKFNG